jgi:hypothetical protein
MPVRREPARDDEIIRYLLGELSEDDAERLDEQSVVDDDFAARLRVVEDDLVDAYASGRLTGDRLKRFEAFYLASPRRRDRAAFARRFLTAVDGDARNRDARVPVQKPPTALARTWWPLAVAAMLCLVVGALLLRQARLLDTARDANERATAADQRVSVLAEELAEQQKATAAAEASAAQTHATPSAMVALVLLPQTRGVETAPLLAVGASAPSIPIALSIEGTAHGPFDASLKDPATNQIVWRSGPLTADAAQPGRLVTVAVPGPLLKAQHYVLDVFAAGSTRGRDFVGSYAFEVVRR